MSNADKMMIDIKPTLSCSIFDMILVNI